IVGFGGFPVKPGRAPSMRTGRIAWPGGGPGQARTVLPSADHHRAGHLGMDAAVVVEGRGVAERDPQLGGRPAAGIERSVVGRDGVRRAAVLPRPHHLLAHVDAERGRVEGGAADGHDARRRALVAVAVAAVVIAAVVIAAVVVAAVVVAAVVVRAVVVPAVIAAVVIPVIRVSMAVVVVAVVVVTVVMAAPAIEVPPVPTVIPVVEMPVV